MSPQETEETNAVPIPERGWKSLYILGGAAAVFVLLASLADFAIGYTLRVDLTKLPGTAIERFAEFRLSPWRGLYHLDLLNVFTTIVLVAAFLALFAAHRRVARGYAALATAVELIGAAVFIANNAALPMLALSAKYATVQPEAQRTLLAAAGESLLAKGEHGTPGVFLAFLLLSMAGLVMSLAILKGGVFNRATAWTGILSNVLLLAYIILVTFVPKTRAVAVLISSPGGLLAIAWLLLIAIGLFRLSRQAGS